MSVCVSVFLSRNLKTKTNTISLHVCIFKLEKFVHFFSTIVVYLFQILASKLFLDYKSQNWYK